MKYILHATLAALLAGAVHAQQPMIGPPMDGPPPASGSGGRNMGGSFFPVEMVMRNQKAISLTAEQQQTLQESMQKSSPQFTQLQWKLSAEEESLDTLIKEQTPDTGKVLAQLDKVLLIENEMKRLQLGLMLAVKNVLTPEQVATLAEIRQRERPPQMGPPPREQGRPQGGE